VIKMDRVGVEPTTLAIAELSKMLFLPITKG
jgi:hypothetical protein